MNKDEILREAIAHQEKAISALKNSIENYREESDLDEDGTLDPEDFSHQVVAKETQLRLQMQLQWAEADKVLLECYADMQLDTIQAGALFRTDKGLFLTGISMGGLLAGEKKLHCMSTKSPIYEKITGKKVGDSFTMGDISHRILEIA